MKILNKTFRRITHSVACVLASFLIMAGLAGTAFADVIWEPENDFYRSHQDECYRVEREYKANSMDEDGLKVYESPASNKVVAVVPNGEGFYVMYRYTDKAGNVWGMNDYYNGWAPMDYLAEVYDGQAFEEEYGSEIALETGDVDISSLTEDDCVYFFKYPGSEEYVTSNVMSDAPYYGYVYDDPEGHKWGYVNYYYLASGWVCIDNPGADYNTLYPNGQSFSGVLKEGEPEKPAVVVEPVTPGINTKLIVGLVIGGILIATGVIIGIVIISKGRGKGKGDAK